MRFRIAMLALVGALAAASPAAFGQAATPAVPRTPDGHPDFGGVWSSWFVTPLERPDDVKTLVVSEAEARDIVKKRMAKARTIGNGVGVDPDTWWSGVDNLVRVNGELRSSLITTPADGKLHLTAEGKKIADAADVRFDAPPDGPEMRGMSERCIQLAGVPPMIVLPNFNMRQIVQAEGQVMLYSEEGRDTRIIPINGVHRPAGVAGPLGDSIAHWEGDVLVVETVGVQVEPDGHLIVRPEDRIIERLSLAGADELLYQYTVEDKLVYSEPWSAEYVMKRTKLPLYEYGCHEANYSLVGMLTAARLDERNAAFGKHKKKPVKKVSAKGRP